MSLTYRPEIDGLRSLAVLSVIVYHLKIVIGNGYLLPGGFLGVDLFFVLSGYLITKILLIELGETGRLDMGQFYLRRARRILPPLLLVIFVSIPAAWAILLPTELLRFSESLMASLFFLSNFFWFFTSSEYGAQSGLLQPFLHTWSLAIEEQFYIVFPLVLQGLYVTRLRRRIGWILLALILFGLALSEVTTMVMKNLSFFSPTSRAWELLCGSGLAWLSIHTPTALKGWKGVRAVPALALVVLAASFVFVELDAVAHPGLVTVPVIAATCALIWFAAPNEPVTRALSGAVPVWIGKLSYSLYLWHFPIFAFGRQLSLDSPTFVHMAIWVALTFAFAWIGYRLIERPFRFSLPLKPFAVVMVTAIAAVPAFYRVVSQNDGFPGRIATGDLAERYGPNEIDNQVLRDQSWSLLREIAGGGSVRTPGGGLPYETGPAWYTDPSSRKILVIGNSHAKDFYNALVLNPEYFQGSEIARFGVSSDFEEAEIEAMLAAPNFQEADIVVVAPRYARTTVARLPMLIETIREQGKDVYVAGNTAEFIAPGERPVFDWFARRRALDVPLTAVNALAHGYEAEEPKLRNRAIEDIARAANVPYLSRRDLLCDDASRSCTLATDDELKTLYDNAHWTLDGATLFGQRMAKRGWFAEESSSLWPKDVYAASAEKSLEIAAQMVRPKRNAVRIKR
jgi:peptidoglycan/LPS O-acetylase OafA/YrhL